MSELDQAFDQLIAAGSAPWIIARKSPAVGPIAAQPPDLPPGSLDVPRLHASGVFEVGFFSDVNGDFYVPDYALLPIGEDPHFAFAVTQTGEIDDDGGPFNRATLTLSVRSFKRPGLDRFEPLRLAPDLGVAPTLTVPVTAQDGTAAVRTVAGNAQDDGNGNIVLTFDLKGSVVEAAYVHLTRVGPPDPATIGLKVGAIYTAYQLAQVTGFNFKLWGDGTGSPFVPIDAGPGSAFWFFLVSARFDRPVSIGSVFKTDVFRSRFTISVDGVVRPIIDVDDLARFTGERSEYRELTSLGNVQARYPSVRALYFGQVSGTVVAVPAVYGIVRGSGGLAASCDSVVDPSPGSSTRCRFHFTFTLAPLVDPIEFASLAKDLPGIPEAAGRTLRLALPPGLDPRFASTLDGFPAGQAGIGDGAAAHTVQISLDIVDDASIPSTSLVNMFLQQLAAKSPAPLFGNLSVRLDDVFPNAIRTQMVLNVRQTAGTDELAIAFNPGEHTAAAANTGPFDVVLHRYAQISQTALTVTSLGDAVLATGQSTNLDVGADEVASIAVSRSLAVPATVPSAQLLKYVRFNTTVVSELQHPLNVNATAVDFTGRGITGIGIAFSLTDSPALPIPALNLSPAHAIDFVHVQIPVDTAVTGLACTVVLTIDDNTGQHTKTLTHDFTAEPILVLTTNTITP